MACGAEESVSMVTGGVVLAGYGGSLMCVCTINADGLIVSCEVPATPGEIELAVAALDELRAARLSGKPLLTLWNGSPGVEP